MSGTIGSPGAGYGFTTRLITNATAIHQQLNSLTEQASSGRVSDTYSGLGDNASVTLNLSPHLASLKTYNQNIGQAIGTMQVTQTAMTQLQQITTKFADTIPNLNGLDPSEVDNVASNARDALTQVADLLNTKDGDVYIFAGQDTGNPPVPAPDSILSSGFYTQINKAVTSLSTNGATSTIAATLAISSSNDSGTSPFSAFLSQPASALSSQVVQTREGSSTRIGLIASANSTATSAGTSTTGSYVRDLLRSLATLGSLSSSQISDPNFASLVQDVGSSLNGAVSAMASDTGALGNIQAGLTETQTQLTTAATALSGQISNVQDADMAATLTKLTATQTQLQESYKLITTANSMSLINFLPAA